MTFRRKIDSSIIWTLAVGFALAILFLLASGYVTVRILDRVESRAVTLVEQQRFSTTLIDEIQGEEAGLSSLFYRIAASPEAVDRRPLLIRLSSIENHIGRTLTSARLTERGERWSTVDVAVREFIQELKQSLERRNGVPSEALYRRHENLVNALGALVTGNYEDAVRAAREEDQRSRRQISTALLLLVAALILSVTCAVWTVRVAKQVFQRLEWQAVELSRLSAHVLEAQEDVIRNFSRELHDDLGQTLSAIEANLAVVQPSSPQQQDRMEDCLLLVKDAIAKTREMSQFLRPTMLDDFGLVPSLQWLADSFTQRTGIQVVCQLDFSGRVQPPVETHLFRLTQEVLTNVVRHSGATRVELILEQIGKHLRLTAADNGRGFSAGGTNGGFGLIGMRERIAASGGRFDVSSTNKGVTVRVEVPIHGVCETAADSSRIS